MGILDCVLFLLFIFSVFLNIYRQTNSLRFKNFSELNDDMYRFGREIPLPYSQALKEVRALEKIGSDVEYLEAATSLIKRCIAHLEWCKLDRYSSYQTIPIWENPVLWGLGRFSGIEHYKRYNFTNYHRTLKRGFGICGDASMVLSQILEKRNIPHNIVAFREHVLVEAYIGSSSFSLDPDFGVSSEHSIVELADDQALCIHEYKSAGYPESDGKLINRILNTNRNDYSSVYAFVPKRYLLEKISYIFYWLSPLIFLLLLFLI